jgi:hypothetical protein
VCALKFISEKNPPPPVGIRGMDSRVRENIKAPQIDDLLKTAIKKLWPGSVF